MGSITKKDKNSVKVDHKELLKRLKALLETEHIDVVHIALESLIEELEEKVNA
jgi:hypothetical protein